MKNQNNVVRLFGVTSIAAIFASMALAETKVSMEQVPAPVKATIEQQAKGAAIKEIELEEKSGEKVYTAEFVQDGKKREILVTPDGKYLGEDKDDDDEDEKEEKVSIDQVPAPVKATIEQQAKGAAIKEIELEEKSGKKVYTAEFVQDGKKREILIAPDGKYLGQDNDDDDEDEKEEVQTKKEVQSDKN